MLSGLRPISSGKWGSLRAAPLGDIVGFHECRLMPGSCTGGEERMSQRRGGDNKGVGRLKREEVRVYVLN